MDKLIFWAVPLTAAESCIVRLQQAFCYPFPFSWTLSLFVLFSDGLEHSWTALQLRYTSLLARAL